MVFVRNAWGPGGFAGPADRFALRFADGHSKPLNAGWQYARIDDSVGQPPNAPWEGSSGVSTIYNAMVAPLGPIGLKGVAWYQGEADVGQPGYDHGSPPGSAIGEPSPRSGPAVRDRRAGRLGQPVARPVESGWASLIDEQRRAAGRDRHAALASATTSAKRRTSIPPTSRRSAAA